MAVAELSHQKQAPTHGLDGLPESGKHQIGAFFKLGNAVLPDAEFLGHASLSEFAALLPSLVAAFGEGWYGPKNIYHCQEGGP